MSEIEKIKRYIERPEMPDDPTDTYCFCLGEVQEIGNFAKAEVRA